MTAGCGGAKGDGDSSDDRTPTLSAAAAVRSAIKALSDAGSARFTTHANLGTYALDQAGLFTLDPAAQITSFTVTAGAATRKIFYIGLHGKGYASLPGADGTPTRCFLTGDPQKIRAITGVDTSGYDTDVPVMAYLLAAARGTSYEGLNGVRGSLDLADVVSVMSSQLTSQLSLKRGEHRVSASFELRDGQFAGFAVNSDDLIKAAKKAGIDHAATVFSSDVVVLGDIDQIGDDVDVSAPEPGDRVRVDQPPAALQAAATRCTQ